MPDTAAPADRLSGVTHPVCGERRVEPLIGAEPWLDVRGRRVNPAVLGWTWVNLDDEDVITGGPPDPREETCYLLAGGWQPVHDFRCHPDERRDGLCRWTGPRGDLLCCYEPAEHPIHNPARRYGWIDMPWLTEEFGWMTALYFLAGAR